MALIKVFYCLIAQKILSNYIKRSFKRHKLTLNHSNVVIVVTMQFITKNDSIGPFVDVFYTFKISILSIMCIIRMIVTLVPVSPFSSLTINTGLPIECMSPSCHVCSLLASLSSDLS